jgi:diguanylate cyclase
LRSSKFTPFTSRPLPRNYEIWYQYATGYYPDLNKSINDTLAQNGKLSDTD